MGDIEAEALLEFLYLTPVGVLKFRPDGAIQLINPVAAQLLMVFARDADLTNLYRVLSPVLPDLADRVARFQPDSGQVCDQIPLAVPRSRTVLTLGINKIDPGTLMAVVQDITRTVEQAARIRDDQQRFLAIFDNVRDYAIYTVDLAGRIEAWNRSLARVGGWEEADVVGAPIAIFYPVEEQAHSSVLLDRARAFGAANFEGWRVRKDGSRFWADTVVTALPGPDGLPTGFVLVTRDLTERKRTEDRLVRLSITDPLTGALNRRAGDDKVRDAFRHLRCDGHAFSLLMIDCDHFKRVNDHWGHDAGDNVLIVVVQICQEKLRPQDTVFRWGGEEFLLLLPDTGLNIALAIAERLRSALEAAKISSGSSLIPITVSIGVTEATILDTSPDDAMGRADRALYLAKAQGRNRVVAA